MSSTQLKDELVNDCELSSAMDTLQGEMDRMIERYILRSSSSVPRLKRIGQRKTRGVSYLTEGRTLRSISPH